VPDFRADTDQISEAGAQVKQVGSALVDSYSGLDPAALGFDCAASALSGFASQWGQGRPLLSTGLRLLGDATAVAAGNYATAEQTITNSANACIVPR
jgi:hypothetical protein